MRLRHIATWIFVCAVALALYMLRVNPPFIY